MIGRRVVIKRGNRDDAEKPFWISFADLMTALMVLFLVSLSVALVRAQDETVKAKQAQEEAAKAKAELEEEKKLRVTNGKLRDDAISACHLELDALVKDFNQGGEDGVRLDRTRHAIAFGSRARFTDNSHELTQAQASDLRTFTLKMLNIVSRTAEPCAKWFKRIVVEGFTSMRGSYLHNLNLSLNRSQRVMCVLLNGEYGTTLSRAIPAAGFQPAIPARREVLQLPEPIGQEESTAIRNLFLIGGYSSNELKPTDEESRRIELRIEFFQLDELKTPAQPVNGDVGKCAIGGR